MQSIAVSAPVTAKETPMQQATKHQLFSLIIVLQTLVGASVVASLETTAGVYKTQPAPTKVSSPPMATSVAEPAVVPAPIVPDRNILRNSFSMLWLAGGAVLGAYVCTALRQALNFTDGPKTFGVAMAFAIPLAAFVLHQYFDNRPEYCFFAGSSFSMGSWFIIEILIALQQKWKKTASEKGLAGLRAELAGTATTEDERKPLPPEPGKM